MNGFRLKMWSQRQQVLAVILLAGGVLFLLWFFLLLPLNRQRRRLEREIEDMQSQLASRNYLLGEEVLQARLQEEERYHRKLLEEWAATTARLACFPDPEDLPPADVRRIDYKLELFDMRHRLLQKSRTLKIPLPHDLGMEDRVESNADARILLLQLRTVEKLVDLVLDCKISLVRRVQPLPPERYGPREAEEALFEEFPVALEFYATRENLYDLLDAILRPDQVFVLRRFRVEAARGQPGLLAVQAQLSGLRFADGRPGAGVPAVPSGPIRSPPRGH